MFDTSIGTCGLAWSSRGIVAVQLPERDRLTTEARLTRRLPSARAAAPPADVAQALDAIVGLLDGEARDLRDIELDMRALSPFDRRVYPLAREVPPGRTITYGEIAAQIGDGDAREIGRSMARNPFPIIVPCHRVVAAGGALGGFSGAGGVATKKQLLEIEGALAPRQPSLFDL